MDLLNHNAHATANNNNPGLGMWPEAPVISSQRIKAVTINNPVAGFGPFGYRRESAHQVTATATTVRPARKPFEKRDISFSEIDFHP